LAENEKVIQLYEDLTNLLVNKVRIEKTGTPSGGEEVTFNCIQTIEGRSESDRVPRAVLSSLY
jgi:hypothetical protein